MPDVMVEMQALRDLRDALYEARDAADVVARGTECAGVKDLALGLRGMLAGALDARTFMTDLVVAS